MSEPTIRPLTELRQFLNDTEDHEHETLMYRASHLKYSAERKLLSGQGASERGRRWNPRDVPTVYLAASPEIAFREYLRQSVEFNISQWPLVITPVDAKLSRILDLCSTKTLEAFPPLAEILQEILQEEWWMSEAPTGWTFTREVIAAGFEGLLVPSIHDPNRGNLAVYRENLRPGSFLKCRKS